VVFANPLRFNMIRGGILCKGENPGGTQQDLMKNRKPQHKKGEGVFLIEYL